MKKKIFYDKKADILYFVLKDGVEDYAEEIEPNVIIEFDKEGHPIGIEILNASSILKRLKDEKDKLYPTFSKQK